MESLTKFFENNYDKIVNYASQILLAIIVLIIGLFVIKKIVKTTKNLMNKKSIDASLVPFLSGMLGAILKVLLVLSILGMVGVEVTSFIAILGAAGLAIGMALSGTLQNFAGGVMILIFKPFKVGDVLEAQGYIGSVAEIQIFNTILKTWDNKTIIIPNGGLSNSSMVNYSTEETRTVEWIFGIGYDDDIDTAREIINNVVYSDDRVIDKTPFINVNELGDSSVNFKVRAKVKSPDYWGVTFDMTERIKKEFDKNGVSIPFPQRDVHIHNK